MQTAARQASEAAPIVTIEDVRADIDRIDDALLALMDERLERAEMIAELKRHNDSRLINLRPDREQDVIERLADEARRMPRQAVATIWRALMAVSLQKQKPMDIAIHTEQQPVPVTDQARLRFGCSARLIAAGSPAEALERARSREAVAVIELTPLSDWWAALYDDPELVIFDCLHDVRGRVSALAVGRIAPEHMRPTVHFDILEEDGLRQRIDAGEPMQPLAASGKLRLCTRHSDIVRGDEQ